MHPHKLTVKATIVACAVICAFLAICAIRLQSHPSTEYDEGIYLTTYRLVQRGFPLYQATFHSQPPGFFLATYPLFLMLGADLPAARLAVFLVSLIGLWAVVWLGWELDNPIAGLIAIGTLYLIPIYASEILTFHADSLPPTFSTLAMAATLRFVKTNQRRWVLLSALFVAIAIAMKADISVLPALLLVFANPVMAKDQSGRQMVQTLASFTVVALMMLLLFVLPFGIASVFHDVITLRMIASAVYPVDPDRVLSFIYQTPQLILVGLFILGDVLAVILVYQNKRSILPVSILATWVVIAFGMLFVYRPLWQHHLVLLAVPVSLLFSYTLCGFFEDIGLSRVLRIVAPLFIAAVLINRFNYAFTSQQGIPNESHERGIRLVQENTSPDDYVVSDDGMVIGLSGRMTPPDLADLSLVRIQSGSLTAENFFSDLEIYKPRMVLVWTGNLDVLNRFPEIMSELHYTLISDADQKQKAYLLNP